ncbi:unnamed protein product [Peniophora sp. CBMAI 1063]|nr:unnamed protein product [Peniophora sp. CBMAI 1063]
MADGSLDVTIPIAVLDGLREVAFLALLLAVLYCFLLCAAIVALYSLLKSGLRSLPNKLNFAAVIVMSSMTTLYTVGDICQVWVVFDVVGGVSNSFDNRISALMADDRLINAAFSVNAIVGDAIILWRVMLIWSWQKRVVYPSILLLCASSVSWLTSTITQRMYVLSNSLSFTISLWATILVSVRAWQRRRMLRKYVAVMSRHNTLESIFNILAETGIVYTAIWAFYLIGEATSDSVPFRVTLTLIMFIVTPLYPIMIVILVAQNKVPISNELHSIEPMTVVLDIGKHAVSDQDSEEGKIGMA